jgi:hypothetical protein
MRWPTRPPVASLPSHTRAALMRERGGPSSWCCVPGTTWLAKACATRQAQPDRTARACARKTRRFLPPALPPKGQCPSQRRQQCAYQAPVLPAAIFVQGSSLPLRTTATTWNIQTARRRPTTGLCNPELCAGFAPHKSLIRSAMFSQSPEQLIILGVRTNPKPVEMICFPQTHRSIAKADTD